MSSRAFLFAFAFAAFHAVFVWRANAQSEFVFQATPLPAGRAFHGSAVLNDYVFVMGGSVEAPEELQLATNSCQVARISEDGQLSRWIGTQPMVLPRHYISNSTIVLNDTVYVLGGSDAVINGNRISTVAYTRAMSNGMLQAWRMSSAFPGSGFSCTASFATPGFLHLTGGTGLDNKVSDQTWTVAVLPDGSLGEWERGPRLPATLWYHSAAVVGGRAFVWGGLNVDDERPKVPSNRVYSAVILSSGRLGPWRQLPTQLPHGMYAAECAVAGPYVFAICPRYEGAVASSDIWWTYVTPSGMQPWQRQPTQLPNNVYIATAQDYRRGIIYITGGKGELTTLPQPQSFMIRLSPRARQLAESQWKSSGGGADASVSEFSARSGAQPSPSTAGIPGFYSLDQGRVISARQQVPLIIYFHVEAANPCRQQAQQFQGEEFTGLTQKAALAAVDASRFPQLAQQHGVFRVPTWICFRADGTEKGRATGIQSITDLVSQFSLE